MVEQIAIAVIPARLASTRFPRKVLASETGLPLVVHTARAAENAKCIERVVIAADDAEIVEAVEPHGIECILTSTSHPNGTSRLAEAAETLGLDRQAIVVNVQGDEPEIEPELIEAAVRRLRDDPDLPVSTAATPIDSAESVEDPNIVKVVFDERGRAMYFSRAAIPHDRDGSGASRYRHIGLYAYRAWFLELYLTLSETPGELAERLEQLRVLEHGHPIGVAVVEKPSPPGIDTAEQYRAFVERSRQAR